MRDNTYKRLQARYGKSRREIARTLVRSRNELLIRFFEENRVLINNDYFFFGSFAMSQRFPKTASAVTNAGGTCDWLCFGAFFCGALLERRLLGIVSTVFDCANIDR